MDELYIMAVKAILIIWLMLMTAMILLEIYKALHKDPAEERMKQREADGYYDRWAEAYAKGEIGIDDELI